jgi:hypothetical protein
MPTPFRRINTTDQILMRLQDAIGESLASLLSVPLLSQVTVSVSLSTSPTAVAHGLGRPVQGWLVVRKNAAADVYEGDVSIAPNKTINLVASASVDVTILFF